MSDQNLATASLTSMPTSTLPPTSTPLHLATTSPSPQPPTSTPLHFTSTSTSTQSVVTPVAPLSQQASLNEDVIGVNSANRPYVGMEFASVEEAKNCYDEYGKRHGFCTLQKDIKRTIPKSNQITSVKFVCQRHGKQSKTSQTYAAEQERYTVATEADARGVKGKRGKARTSSSVRVGCKAAMRAWFDRSRDRYIVSVFNDEHNHGLVTPKKRQMMRSMRRMPKTVRKLAETFQAEGVRVSSLPNLFGGDTIGFDSRHCYNHLQKLRHKVLEAGDAQFVLNFFQKKQVENPSFYYAIQCDEEGILVF